MNQLSAPQPTAGGGKATLDAATFDRIAALAYSEAGLSMSPTKSAMVHTRLARRLRALRLNSYDAYCSLIESEAGRDERREMISALTTNVSHFFREQHHFDLLRDRVVPQIKQKLESGGRARLWSAGCSNGQEPYSIAIVLSEAGLAAEKHDVRILASDIDPKVVRTALRGVYPTHMQSGLDDSHRAAHFDPAPQDGKDALVAKQHLRDLIAFRELNLLKDWPMRGRFDAVFCRNVVIYFDAETQAGLWGRFAAASEPGGWLFIGHSERVAGPHAAAFENTGMTAYRRLSTKVSAPLNSERTQDGPA